MFDISLKRYIDKNSTMRIKSTKFRIYQFLKFQEKKNSKKKSRLKWSEAEYNFAAERQLYIKVYGKLNIGFFPTINFNIYQWQIRWFKRKYLNKLYHNLIANIKEDLEFFEKKRARYQFLLDIKKPRFIRLQEFLYTYNLIFTFVFIDLFFLLKFFKIKQQRTFYYLILTFERNKLKVNLQNYKKKNYLFLSAGLFIKFFEKKKSFKKNKMIKLLMAKCIRKIFLLSKITTAILIVKKTPSFLIEILNFINSPILHKFENPFDKSTVEEKFNNSIWIKFLYFVFLENKSYVKNKMQKKGRIKRKILRKLVLENKIVD